MELYIKNIPKNKLLKVYSILVYIFYLYIYIYSNQLVSR